MFLFMFLLTHSLFTISSLSFSFSVLLKSGSAPSALPEAAGGSSRERRGATAESKAGRRKGAAQDSKVSAPGTAGAAAGAGRKEERGKGGAGRTEASGKGKSAHKVGGGRRRQEEPQHGNLKTLE